MAEQNRDINSSVRPPIVMVFARDQDVAVAYAQVNHALREAGVDCILLESQNASSEMIHRRVGMQVTVLEERPPIEFSIVIPIYNEDDSIPELYRRLTKVMTELAEPYELIFVNDGSRDRSLELLREIHGRDPCVRVISLARNFGHQQAISAGIDHARGQAAIVMDGDLQDPPEVIPQFVEKWRQGFQVVYAVREKRKEHILKRSLYHSFYLILQGLSRIDIPLDAGDFCLMDRRVVDILIALPERHRFVRGLRSWAGFRQIGLAYERDARFAGNTKYTFRKLSSLALEGLISFSYLPLRLSTILGFGVSVLSLLTAMYYVIRKLTIGLRPPGFATLTVLLLFLGGVQLLTIGVAGEYIGHILMEVKKRPTYIVHQALEH